MFGDRLDGLALPNLARAWAFRLISSHYESANDLSRQSAFDERCPVIVAFSLRETGCSYFADASKNPVAKESAIKTTASDNDHCCCLLYAENNLSAFAPKTHRIHPRGGNGLDLHRPAVRSCAGLPQNCIQFSARIVAAHPEDRESEVACRSRLRGRSLRCSCGQGDPELGDGTTGGSGLKICCCAVMPEHLR